jgi:acyl-CoA reductase-like NAD-dependent aldehyde dehydrogenase
MTVTDPSSVVERHVADRDFKMLIGGDLVEAADGARAETFNPSTGAVLTTVPEAGADDVARAVASAGAAQPAWERLGLEGRTACFHRFDELLEDHLEDLAMLDAIDGGNPVRAMRADVQISRIYVRGWPALAQSLHGEVIPASSTGLHYTRFRPYGVVGRITAFNHPVMFAATRPLPALIAGNTVVMKPAPQTPLGTLRLAELFAEAFPAGVVNVVTGGASTGDTLVTHPDVKRIAFTGSLPTGLVIQRRAAESGHVKEVSLELGGKNAMVVFPDVDLDAAVEGAIYGMNFNVCQGQSCGSNSRVLVHRRVYDDFVERAVESLRRYRVTSAYSEDADMGPLVSDTHLERVRSYLDAGSAQGANLVTGGDRPADAPEHGYFLNPVVFADVSPEMRIAREEIFGPVMSVMVWDDYDDMIEVANGVEYGLAASVWTNDLTLAHRTADALDAGYVWVNDSTRHYFGTPFGGTKNSGTGREESVEELRSYLETKVVHMALGDPADAFRRLAGS